MNIILNHKHDAEVQSQLDAANYYAHTRTVDIFYMLDIGKNRTLRGVRSYIRGELCGKYGVALSHIKTVKDTLPVTFLLTKRIEKEC